jgi:hypothetical protein
MTAIANMASDPGWMAKITPAVITTITDEL